MILAAGIYMEGFQEKSTPYKLLVDNELGSVERITYGCETSVEDTIVLITGIHPRENNSIEPEIQAAKEYVEEHSFVNVVHYQINATPNEDDYDQERGNGEMLARDYVIPDLEESGASFVIIGHSYFDDYGKGAYIATPDGDEGSVEIAKKIYATSDFGYYQESDGDSYEATSSQLVSCPIAEEGYLTFEYYIPDYLTAENSTDKTKELFVLLVKYVN